MLYPLVFEPIFKERVWGGRELERLFAKKIPAGKPIGESWEISDRPGDRSEEHTSELQSLPLHAALPISFSRSASGADANWNGCSPKKFPPANPLVSRGKSPTGPATPASSPTARSPEKICAG